jgi:hypothetical protein
MHLRNRSLGVLLGATVFALSAAPASATSFMLSLTGSTADFSTQTLNTGGKHYEFHTLSLAGLSDANAIQVSQGDMISANITLDGLYTIPASETLTNVGLFLTAPSFPQTDTAVTGTTTFDNGLTQTGQTLTSAQLVNGANFFPPDNGPISFTSLTSSFTIDTLSASTALNSASFQYVLVSNVPEPSAWLMMVGGVGGLGGMLRSRRKPMASVATT